MVERHPIREVWAQAWPSVLTMVSYTSMQFVGALMVAQVGPVEIAAQGSGGIWSFVPLAFLFGVLVMVNTFTAQNLGAGRRNETARFAWTGLWFSLAVWIVVMLPWAFFLPYFFKQLGHSELLCAQETKYAVTLVLGSLIALAGKCMSNFFFGLQRPRVIALAAIVGNIVNLFLSYAFIFGQNGLPSMGLPGIPGLPALGILGAAIATLCGTCAELSLPLSIFFSAQFAKDHGVWESWRPSLVDLKKLVRVGWPVSIQFGNEIVCWAIFMTLLVGRFGEIHLSAGWATLRYMNLSFMPAVGFSVAATALVGKYIGAGRPDLAANRAHWGVLMAAMYMTVCGVVMAIFREPLISLFATSSNAQDAEKILRIGSHFMICAAVFQTFDAVGIVYTGALRGAGDTVVPGLYTIAFSWIFIVLGGWIFAVEWPGLESLGPWIASAFYIIVLGAFMAKRFEGGRWKQIRLLETNPIHG